MNDGLKTPIVLIDYKKNKYENTETTGKFKVKSYKWHFKSLNTPNIWTTTVIFFGTGISIYGRLEYTFKTRNVLPY